MTNGHDRLRAADALLCRRRQHEDLARLEPGPHWLPLVRVTGDNGRPAPDSARSPRAPKNEGRGAQNRPVVRRAGTGRAVRTSVAFWGSTMACRSSLGRRARGAPATAHPADCRRFDRKAVVQPLALAPAVFMTHPPGHGHCRGRSPRASRR
jgi:hypothetical protein